MELHGKVALVTGSAHRVGKAIALALAGEGAHVLVHFNTSADEAESAVEEIAEHGVVVQMAQADLSQPDQIERVFNAVRAHFGRLDILVNSAASFQKRDFFETTLEDWDYTMAVNLRAPFLCGQYAARMMLESGEGGVIINVSDMIGLKPRRTYVTHSVSKAALVALTQVMALSLGPGIRVNAVAPGHVLKPEKMDLDDWDRMGVALPLQRSGHVRNVQQAVLSLVHNDFVTGHVLVVDGGESLLSPFHY